LDLLDKLVLKEILDQLDLRAHKELQVHLDKMEQRVHVEPMDSLDLLEQQDSRALMATQEQLGRKVHRAPKAILDRLALLELLEVLVSPGQPDQRVAPVLLAQLDLRDLQEPLVLLDQLEALEQLVP
jgi:hypothetical protein